MCVKQLKAHTYYELLLTFCAGKMKAYFRPKIKDNRMLDIGINDIVIVFIKINKLL